MLVRKNASIAVKRNMTERREKSTICNVVGFSAALSMNVIIQSNSVSMEVVVFV